jgi:phosphatidylinositol phospholipase C delta
MTTTYRVCCFLRRFRAASNEPSEAVRDVFQAYADGGGVVGEEALRRLLREVQGETEAGADAAAKEVMAFAAEQRLLKKGGLTAEGFHRWLFSDANAALDPRRGVSFPFPSTYLSFFLKKKISSVHELLLSLFIFSF